MTQGRATYTRQFARYEEVPPGIAEEIMAKVAGKPPARAGPLEHLGGNIMAKAKYERTEAARERGDDGHIDHGQDDADARSRRWLHTKNRRLAVGSTGRSTRAEEREGGITIAVGARGVRERTSGTTRTRLPGAADYIKNMITGAAQMDGRSCGGGE